MWVICCSGANAGLVWCNDDVQREIDPRDPSVRRFPSSQDALDYVRQINRSSDGYFAMRVPA